MKKRILLLAVAVVLVVGGLSGFLWLTGGSGGSFLNWMRAELSLGWRAVENSSTAQKVMVFSGLLVVGAMLIVLKSLRKS